MDCPSGASSFVAEVKEKYGINAIGCDPLFGDDLKRLFERGEADIEYVTQRVSLAVNLYNWDFYPSIKALKEYRTQALRQFISDYPAGIIEKRYIKAECPKLPFDDKSFDLVLSGHFLFTYSHKFDFSFLLSSVLELFRVSAREVRIYPLQGSDAQPYKHMTDLLSALKAYGIVKTILGRFHSNSSEATIKLLAFSTPTYKIQTMLARIIACYQRQLLVCVGNNLQ